MTIKSIRGWIFCHILSHTQMTARVFSSCSLSSPDTVETVCENSTDCKASSSNPHVKAVATDTVSLTRTQSHVEFVGHLLRSLNSKQRPSQVHNQCASQMDVQSQTPPVTEYRLSASFQCQFPRPAIFNKFAIRYLGKVKYCDNFAGRGLIQVCNSDDVFMQFQNITKKNPGHIRQSVVVGETVEFEIVRDVQGRREAINITGPNLTSVQGNDCFSIEFIQRAQAEENARFLQLRGSRIIGEVKQFDLFLGYGFITVPTWTEDVFFHFTNIDAKNPCHHCPSIADGEAVEFELRTDEQGRRFACHITGPNRAPVRGNIYFSPEYYPLLRNSKHVGHLEPGWYMPVNQMISSEC